MYTHPDYYIHIQDFRNRRTSPAQKRSRPGASAAPSPPRGSASGVPSPHLATRAPHTGKAKRENAGRRAAREQQLPFFLLKSHLMRRSLSPPRRKSREHHRSPGLQGTGTPRMLPEVRFPTVASVPDCGRLEKRVNLGWWRLILKVREQGTLLVQMSRA